MGKPPAEPAGECAELGRRGQRSGRTLKFGGRGKMGQRAEAAQQEINDAKEDNAQKTLTRGGSAQGSGRESRPWPVLPRHKIS